MIFYFLTTWPHCLTHIVLLLCCTVHQRIKHTYSHAHIPHVCTQFYIHFFPIQDSCLFCKNNTYICSNMLNEIYCSHRLFFLLVDFNHLPILISGASTNAEFVEIDPAADCGSLLAPRLFALPQSFLVHDVCVSVCDALNPIDRQTCYQGQIVHQGKMPQSVEVDPNLSSPHLKVLFHVIVMSRSHASCPCCLWTTDVSEH